MSGDPHWDLLELGSIADFVMGQAPPGQACNTDGIGTPFVKVGEFGVLRPIIREWTTKPLKLARQDDVLICVVGATCGKLNYGADCAIGRSVAAIRPTQVLDQQYLFGFLTTLVARLRAGSVGSAQGVISKEALAQISIPLPPAAEQRRIVAKIARLTARSKRARDELDQCQNLAVRYKNSVLAAAYSDASDATIALRELVSTLDQGWSPKCEVGPAAPGSWAVMRTTAVQPFHFQGHENKALPKGLAPRVELEIKRDDVIVTRAGPRNRVGIACMADRDHPGVMLCDKVYRLRPKADCADPKYITLMLNSPQCLDAIENIKSGGNDSGLNLTQSKFLAIGLPAIPVSQQREIVRRVEHAFAAIDRLAAEAQSARALLDKLDQAILAKAFRGELVPQDPDDEPASVLLDRIRAGRDAAPAKQRGRRTRVAQAVI